MGQANRRPGVLARPGFAAQLAGDLGDLPEPGGADRMAHGQQAPRGADGVAPADVEVAPLEALPHLTLATEAHGLDVEQLLDGKGVMDLDDVEVPWFAAPLLVGGQRGGPGQIHVRVASERPVVRC